MPLTLFGLACESTQPTDATDAFDSLHSLREGTKGSLLPIDIGSLVLVDAVDGALFETNARRVLVVIVGSEV